MEGYRRPIGFIEYVRALKYHVHASSAEIQGRFDETTCISATKSLIKRFRAMSRAAIKESTQYEILDRLFLDSVAAVVVAVHFDAHRSPVQPQIY